MIPNDILMKKITLVIVCSLVVFTGMSQQVISADDPAIRYTGRFDFSNPAKPAFMYSGCTISMGFTGTSISVQLMDDSLRNWFTIKLDDSIVVLETKNKSGVYELAKNLANKKHHLHISRRTEWHGGITKFLGFNIDKGATIFPLPANKRTIEFIGNSLTCGYGNEGKNREEHFNYATENSDLAYGALLAKSLNADYIFVCRSGIGMYQSYDGDTNFVQPKLYDEIITGKTGKSSQQVKQPDVVVIELGANDLAKPLDSAAFANAYIKFIKKIRIKYPQAKIICAAGPDLPADNNSKFQSYVTAITRYVKPTDKNVFNFYFGRVDANGSDWHPNLQEHQQMAAALLPFVKEVTGW